MGRYPLSHLSDADFAGIFQNQGPAEMARNFTCSVQAVQSRKMNVEARLGIILTGPNSKSEKIELSKPFLSHPIEDGVVLVGSDGHYWPGAVSTAHRAFVAFIEEMKPSAVIFNGDALDGATISRFPPIGWENLPTLEQEVEECQVRLGEIEQAAGKKARLYWPLGNHDSRFNMRLAAMTPEFKGVQGTRLVHHFPAWEPCWAVEVGGKGGAVVKHRYKGGMHAPHNNALWSGRTMVTGHLHSQKVTPITDYNGTRWGVDTGCLAAVGGPQFAYAEANPQNWRGGFCVLTFRDGSLLPPELVMVMDEEAGDIWWRGELYVV